MSAASGAPVRGCLEGGGHQGEGSLTPSSRRLELSTTSYCAFAPLSRPGISCVAALVLSTLLLPQQVGAIWRGVDVLVDRLSSRSFSRVPSWGPASPES